jgi:DNA-binding transcriptional LysR family regulator
LKIPFNLASIVNLFTMTDWENLRHFVTLARAGTLSAAARTLGVEHATVARRIAALETELNLKLVDRRGRRLSLTPEGERIATLAERMEKDAGTIARTAEAAQSVLQACVTISAPPSLANTMLAGPVVAIRKNHPGLTIRLFGESRTASLERREADIAIRLSRPESGDLTIVKLADIPYRLYASPAYLAETPPEHWTFIGYDDSLRDTPNQIALLKQAGRQGIGLQASTADFQQAAAQVGGGLAMLPDYMAAPDPALVPADPDGPPAVTREVWMVIHSDLRDAPAIRTVADALRTALRPSGKD